MPEQTPEQLAEKEHEVNQKVDEAGEKAKEKASAEGAKPEEIQAAVERARKEEKDKLYPQIEDLRGSLKEVQNILKAERDEKERTRKEVEKEAEKERQSKLSDQERVAELLTRLEEKLNDERSQREGLEKKIAEKDRKAELGRYREALIKANEDQIIPDLVIGDSKEELDKALEVAKVRYKEYEERFKQRQGEETRRHMPGVTNPDYEALEELELSKDLTALDRDKYLEDPAYRARIQAELENEYARLAGRR